MPANISAVVYIRNFGAFANLLASGTANPSPTTVAVNDNHAATAFPWYVSRARTMPAESSDLLL